MAPAATAADAGTRLDRGPVAVANARAIGRDIGKGVAAVNEPRTGRRARITLDSQLVTYWDREAARLDALAGKARFGWIARRYRRKADVARAQAERSRAREAARGAAPDATA
ncbi:hypothetical protein [Methylobacterium soli]|jgi:hypothetical protein|uniref:hypothetical protein n=1 Tax=Methylobacterium soli TaxID=553447 RepID=UPI003CC839DD